MKKILISLIAVAPLSTNASTCYLKETQEIFRAQDHYLSTGSYEHRVTVQSLEDCLNLVNQMRDKLGSPVVNDEKVCINEEIGTNVQCESMKVQRTIKKISFAYFDGTSRRSIANGVFKH